MCDDYANGIERVSTTAVRAIRDAVIYGGDVFMWCLEHRHSPNNKADRFGGIFGIIVILHFCVIFLLLRENQELT